MEPLTRLEKNRRKRARERARLKIRRLVRIHGSRCYWCGVDLVPLSTLPAGSSVMGNRVYWVEGGEEKVMHWATVDHVIPLGKGGSSRLDNLVPACFGCNGKRSEQDFDAELLGADAD